MISSCRHFSLCSGCTSIGVPYAQQLDDKLEAVRGIFEQFGGEVFDADMPVAIAASPRQLSYRNRVKLVPARHLSGRGADGAACSGIALGLYRAESHEVIDIPGCPVQMDGLNKIVEVIRAGIRKHDIGLYDENAHHGDLRFVSVREGHATGERLVGFVTRDESCANLEGLAGELMNCGMGVVGVLQNINPEKGNVIFGPGTRLLAGRDYLEELVCNVRLRLGLTSFFQINTAMAELVYLAVIDGLEVTQNDTLLDLYCGVGTIGLVAAGEAERVVGIEEAEEAVELGRASAEANGLGNITFVAGLVEEQLPAIVNQLHDENVDEEELLTVINPPRKGVDPEVIAQLCRLRSWRIAYLSCYPFSLVRDMKRFTETGYHLHSLELFDMFPQTEQVETLAILQR
jgi:23S rRNA (uracil1939-C5)-methyltransferase